MGYLIYAIIPARSGSKGIPNKNILKIEGKELLGYSIEFAKKLNIDRIFCSTDKKKYSTIAKRFGAEVPSLRSSFASSDTAMEEDILTDLYNKFDEVSIPYPDLFVWLRPTFVFRDISSVKKCISKLIKDDTLDSCRVVTEAESRLYKVKNNKLFPSFDDNGKSMIRRQDVVKKYRVYNTDIFRGNPKNCNDKFLGENIGYVIANKICGLDIDDGLDFLIVSDLIKYHKGLVNEYL